QNRIDPYQGGVNAVTEAFCNTVSVGAEAIALSDCLCYGNPEKPDQMRLFAEGCKGVADAASALNIPIIAGNVSLYNESARGSIPPSPMIAVLGRLEEVKHALSQHICRPGLEIYLIGERKPEFGGSIYYELLGHTGSSIPLPDLEELKRSALCIRSCSKEGLLEACHDISEGGLAVSLAEMLFKHEFGCNLKLPENTKCKEEAFLFAESFGFLLAVDHHQREAFLLQCKKYQLEAELLGNSNESGIISLGSHINIPLQTAKDAWMHGLRRSLS
ncbi:MAG: AIR synthase-related protein, partial [Spirochaetales bacterium]|nr:AIR synthase-related protein [Spirochaetales bacterium]